MVQFDIRQIYLRLNQGESFRPRFKQSKLSGSQSLIRNYDGSLHRLPLQRWKAAARNEFKYFCDIFAHHAQRPLGKCKWELNDERFLIRPASSPLPTRQILFQNNPWALIKASSNSVLMENGSYALCIINHLFFTPASRWSKLNERGEKQIWIIPGDVRQKRVGKSETRRTRRKPSVIESMSQLQASGERDFHLRTKVAKL